MFFAVSEEAEMAHTHESFWNDVEQETANELVGSEGHGFFLIVVLAIPIGEGNCAVIHGQDTIVGESDAVGVSAEVVEDVLGRAEGLFGVDDPGFFAQGIEQGHEV